MFVFQICFYKINLVVVDSGLFAINDLEYGCIAIKQSHLPQIYNAHEFITLKVFLHFKKGQGCKQGQKVNILCEDLQIAISYNDSTAVKCVAVIIHPSLCVLIKCVKEKALLLY